MSEKYSMNELLAWIEKQCSLVDGEWGCASSCEDECKGPKDAIIAQLRAADKMYGAAKEAWPQMFWHNWNNECQRLYEAIAEYGGKA